LRTRCPWTVQRRNFVSKQSWKFEKDNFVISILEKRVISTIHKFLFGKTCCHNDSWGLGIFEFYLEKRFNDSLRFFWIWNAADLRPRKIEKTWPNNSLVKNNFKICRFENGPFGKRRKFKSSISRNAPYSPY
jgi:hypothetical protein